MARLANEVPGLVTDGIIKKIKARKKPIADAERRFADQIEDPRQPFDVLKLEQQLSQECVKDGSDGQWGEADESSLTWCLPLRTRIAALVRSPAFAPVFGAEGKPFGDALSAFLSRDDQKVLRLCMSGVSYEFRAREYIVNAVGRHILREARNECFVARPLVVIVDEAHNFLGHSVGGEESAVRLDAFELIAREGRKYGLNLCLATQRPRDLTEGVLSQMGTLIVHRLTNDRDREIVERACGEVDRSATAFLANLRQGQAVIIGVDFPIPLTVQIHKPSVPPRSDGPDFQVAWAAGANTATASA